jgi:hypothetical protein
MFLLLLFFGAECLRTAARHLATTTTTVVAGWWTWERINCVDSSMKLFDADTIQDPKTSGFAPRPFRVSQMP